MGFELLLRMHRIGGMAKRIDFSLSDEQIAELSEAIKQDKRPEVRQRATAIRLLSRGDNLQSVAQVMAVTGSMGWPTSRKVVPGRRLMQPMCRR